LALRKKYSNYLNLKSGSRNKKKKRTTGSTGCVVRLFTLCGTKAHFRLIVPHFFVNMRVNGERCAENSRKRSLIRFDSVHRYHAPIKAGTKNSMLEFMMLLLVPI